MSPGRSRMWLAAWAAWVASAAPGGAAPAHAAADGAVRVHVEAADLAPLAAVRDRVASLPWIDGTAPEGEADLRVAVEGGAIVLRTEDGPLRAPPVPLGAPEAGRRAAERVVAWAHRQRMHRLENPGSALRVAFRLERAEGSGAPGGLRVAEPGAKLRWEATNRSERTVHMSVFDVSPDGGVTLLHPRRGPGARLDPGETADQTVTMRLPDDWESGSDVFTLVATAGPLDPAGFLAPETLAGALERLEASDWQVFRREVRVRRELAVAPAERAEPAGHAATVAPREAHPGPRKLSFAVHFATDVDLGRVRHRVAKLRTLCGRNGFACEVRRLAPGGAAFELERTGRRLGEDAKLTVASAFEQAYAIRDGLDALRVEPLLDLARPAGSEPSRAVVSWAAQGGAVPTAPPGALSLFHALHTEGTPPARAAADYRRLFGLGAGTDLGSVAYLEAELLHHYVLDEAVRRAIDALTAPGADAAAAAEARAALLRRGLSAPLRAALSAAP